MVKRKNLWDRRLQQAWMVPRHIGSAVGQVKLPERFPGRSIIVVFGLVKHECIRQRMMIFHGFEKRRLEVFDGR